MRSGRYPEATRRNKRIGGFSAATATTTARGAAQIDCAAFGEHRLNAGVHGSDHTQPPGPAANRGCNCWPNTARKCVFSGDSESLVWGLDVLSVVGGTVSSVSRPLRRIAIPTARFRDRLTAMATRREIAVIGVDPAYTSKWGDQHWRKPLQQQTSDPVTRHHGAAAAIGRRGLGKPIRRRPVGPRTQQRMGAGTPPARPVRTPKTQGGANRSGSPSRPAGVPVRRTACTTRGQDRSGRNRTELTSAQ